MKLADRTAVVTCAASGIGRAVAELFAAEGARVAAVDSDGQSLGALVEAVASAGGACRGLECDVSDFAAADAAVASLAEDWGAPTVLVTCAAISLGGPATATSAADWARVFAVNVTGTFAWVRAVLPAMERAGGGAIVTLASQLALAGGRGNAAYVASKGAVIALTRSLALDYAERGIRANALVPGAIETPMLERSFARQEDPQGARERSRARHPLGRFGSPREVALGALYLASDDAAFTTGALLPVDGGWLAG